MRATQLLWVGIGGLFLLTVGVWYAVYEKEHAAALLTVSFLDVGQGDAIFIEAPNGNQLLIDGGKGSQVLRGLGRTMGFFDRSIDVVLATHPDMDHIGGLPDVFSRYAVSYALVSGVADEGSDEKALEQAIGAEGLAPILARRGMRIVLDKTRGVALHILFPDRDVSQVESNTGSIVAQLTYGSTAFMLTGDSPQAIEEYLVGKDGAALKSNVLKLGHHGSRTSNSEEFLDVVHPDYAIVSAGKDNTYGHPHPEVVARVRNSGTAITSTIDSGTIIFESDGTRVWEK